jgi:predicted ArsR family transcriptional regulator
VHPVRYRLLKLLAEKPMHINAFASALGLERRLVSYHLATLEAEGFVTSKYGISEEPRAKGKAIRVYTVTDKVMDVRAKLKKGL